MEGYLLKWENYVYFWQRRYFILHKGVLYVSKAKGLPSIGTIHLGVSQIIKNHKKPTRFYIDTGMNKVHLKAYSITEADDWYRALLHSQSEIKQQESEITIRPSLIDSDNSSLHYISTKIGEMWSVHAQIEETLDLLPSNLVKNTPGLIKASKLCGDIKNLASEMLGIIEEDPSHVKSLNNTDFGSFEITKGNKQSILLAENPKNINIGSDFEDAQSSGKFELASDYHVEFTPRLPHRTCLPYLRDPTTKYYIWKVIKDSIGLDLSKIAVPVYYNEPISMLQRITEDLSYNEIILKACDSDNSLLRLAYVACFAVTSYTSSDYRNMKPFNPLLGETFELEADNFHLISEQVSHHPPISALHCEHPRYIFWGSTEIRNSFKGTYLLINPLCPTHLVLKETGDHFFWTKPQTSAHNIIIGRIYVQHFGRIEIINYKTGEKAILEFKKAGWFEKRKTEVTGSVYDTNGTEKYQLKGHWNKGMEIMNLETQEVIEAWSLHPFPENFEWNYYFNDFGLQLNISPDLYPAAIAPTDSRYRPDQRALESGDLKTAGSEKLRLEEKQRAARRKLEESGEIYKPRWFTLENEEWKYIGGYWENKEKVLFVDVPDIF
ncbi:unnamed protein product [Blepharisma stoltei]|uniref:PH domain-containing protein n=1 Tax=Blepharisma stoltei TaxID=1481888 RepID=A0AAU9JVC4_9CILI|nr:unnamed protein product [Blepharisma stoltei]